MNASKRNEIILIGPMLVGKSTIAQAISRQTGIPVVSLDAIRFSYFDEIGYDKDLARAIEEDQGRIGLMRYWKPFELYAIERVFLDYHDCIYDFGAGFSAFDNQDSINKVKDLFSAFQNIFLLLPFLDIAKSYEYTLKRFCHRERCDISDVTESEKTLLLYFIEHQLNKRLATHILFCEHRLPHQLGKEIYQMSRNFDAHQLEKQLS